MVQSLNFNEKKLKKDKKKLAIGLRGGTIKRMKKITIATAVWKEGKHYVAQCLNVDVASFGKNKPDALKNLKEALELYFEDAPTLKIGKVEKPSIELQHV